MRTRQAARDLIRLSSVDWPVGVAPKAYMRYAGVPEAGHQRGFCDKVSKWGSSSHGA